MWILLEVLLIGLLVLANGFFAAAELAIVAGSRHRLRALADKGNRAAGSALNLAERPDQVLATVQVGITLIGAFAAAYGGATLVLALERAMVNLPVAGVSRQAIALALFTAVLTFVQVVLGELVPKRIALADPTRLACLVAAPLQVLRLLGTPIVWLMNRCTDALLALLRVGVDPADSKVDLQEIRQLVEVAAGQGVLDPIEQHVVLEALHLGDQTVRQVMTSREDIDAADVDTPSEQALGVVLMSGFSRLPVYASDLDHIQGYVNARDVMLQNYLGRPISFKKLLRPIYFVPEVMRLDQLLVEFKKRKTTLAVVVDEHGRTKGLVTQEDVVDELVGEILAPAPDEPNIIPRPEGGWFVEGRTPVGEMLKLVKRPQVHPPRRVHTVAGLALDLLGHLPQVGEFVHWQGLRLEIIDMDGKRIDKLLVTRDDKR